MKVNVKTGLECRQGICTMTNRNKARFHSIQSNDDADAMARRGSSNLFFIMNK
jgi:hypothetical protein